MNRIVFVALGLALAGCGGPAVSQVVSSRPLGTLSGLVLNTRFAPLDGVNVTLVLGEGADGSATYKTTTNASGGFFFKGLPAGSVGLVTVTRAGFGTARVAVSVPASAGNFPLDDGNGNAGIFLLTELNGTQRFTVYSASGKPAKGVRGLLEVSPSAFSTTSSGTYGTGQGVISAEATGDESGVLLFTGIPSADEMARVGGSYTLIVGALDENGDGVIDSLGTARTYTGASLFINPTQTIQLTGAASGAPLAISSANLDSLTNGGASQPYLNALKPNEAITIVFNQAIAEATRTVKVVGEDCATNVAVVVTQRAPNVLSIAPTGSWTTGAEYHLAIRATGLDSGVTRDFRAFFFAIDPAAPRPVGRTPAFSAKKAPGNSNTARFEPGDELYVTFDTPLSYLGGPQGRAFFNYDLNGNGSIGGGDVGEVGSPFSAGFTIDLAEETYDAANSTFTCRTNNYGSRFRINSFGIPSGGLPSNTAMRVTLPDGQASSTGYQTAWGQVATGDFNGSAITIRQ